MASWSQFESDAPDLARRVRERLEAHKHKTIATLRRDGSPRISGTEAELKDGELWIGSGWRALKALDLQRDPRFALHSGSDEPDDWSGDAKLAGTAEESGSEQGKAHQFRLELDEVSTVELDDARTHLVIQVWTPGAGVRTLKRF